MFKQQFVKFGLRADVSHCFALVYRLCHIRTRPSIWKKLKGDKQELYCAHYSGWMHIRLGRMKIVLRGRNVAIAPTIAWIVFRFGWKPRDEGIKCDWRKQLFCVSMIREHKSDGRENRRAKWSHYEKEHTHTTTAQSIWTAFFPWNMFYASQKRSWSTSFKMCIFLSSFLIHWKIRMFSIIWHFRRESSEIINKFNRFTHQIIINCFLIAHKIFGRQRKRYESSIQTLNILLNFHLKAPRTKTWWYRKKMEIDSWSVPSVFRNLQKIKSEIVYAITLVILPHSAKQLIYDWYTF